MRHETQVRAGKVAALEHGLKARFPATPEKTMEFAGECPQNILQRRRGRLRSQADNFYGAQFETQRHILMIYLY